ncbi:hypothetical protein PSTT_02121 [Puccinia striiformis]|uniref:Uncharacterized protein n=1 Tax=Puccinia striiformis TaxID=27350 RepID=A0A2S4W180_9BASI|nr:hypothetical protein PSTT_02121 [Puccinia striiformis]
MAIPLPSHLSARFTAESTAPCSRSASPSAIPTVLSPVTQLLEKNRKKEFPSVAKLLDGLTFQDETHPDFLLRASSSRFSKSKAMNSLHRPSSSLLGHLPSPLYVRSTTSPSSSSTSPGDAQATAGRPLRGSAISKNRSPLHHFVPPPHPETLAAIVPLPRLLLQVVALSRLQPVLNHQSQRHPKLPSRRGPLNVPTIPLKRIDGESSDDDDDCQNSGSDSGRRYHTEFGLGIDWHSELKQSRRADYRDRHRPIARPSRTWLNKKPVLVDDRSTNLTTLVVDRACLGKQQQQQQQIVVAAAGTQQLIELELMASRPIEIRQVDKRRLVAIWAKVIT